MLDIDCKVTQVLTLDLLQLMPYGSVFVTEMVLLRLVNVSKSKVLFPCPISVYDFDFQREIFFTLLSDFDLKIYISSVDYIFVMLSVFYAMSFMLSVTYKPLMLNVIVLIVVVG